MADVSYRPTVTSDGIAWILELPEGRTAAARAVLAWGALTVSGPGRLRPCANSECQLFLIDHDDLRIGNAVHPAQPVGRDRPARPAAKNRNLRL